MSPFARPPRLPAPRHEWKPRVQSPGPASHRVSRQGRALGAALALLTPLFSHAQSISSQNCPLWGCPIFTVCDPATPDMCWDRSCTYASAYSAFVCGQPLCSDVRPNGNETGIDCGGEACGGCDAGVRCLVSTDCTSGICANAGAGTPIRCQTGTCSDGVQNGDESDVDCGGYACCANDQDPANCLQPCAAGYTCLSGADCASGLCFRSARAGVNAMFCTQARTPAQQPRTSSRLLLDILLLGGTKATVRGAALVATIASYLEVDVGAVSLDALVDLRRPLERGLGAYATSRPELYGGNFTTWYAAWRAATPNVDAGSWLKSAVAALSVRPYRITSTDVVYGVRAVVSVFTPPVEAGLTLYRARLLQSMYMPAGGSYAPLRAALTTARQEEEARRFCYTWSNVTTAPLVPVGANRTCADVLTRAQFANAPSTGSGSANASANVTALLRAIAFEVNLTLGLPVSNCTVSAAATNASVPFAAALCAAMPGAFTAVLIPPSNTSADAAYLAAQDVRNPIAAIIVRPVRGAPSAPLYAGNPFAQQPMLRLVDRFDRAASDYPFDIRVTVAAFTQAMLDATGAPLQIELQGSQALYMDATGHVEWSDLRVASNYSSVVLVFTARVVDATTNSIRYLNVTTSSFDVALQPVAPIELRPIVPLHPAIVFVIVFVSLSVLSAVVYVGVKRMHQQLEAARVLPDLAVVPAAVDGPMAPPLSTHAYVTPARVAVPKLPLPEVDLREPPKDPRPDAAAIASLKQLMSGFE